MVNTPTSCTPPSQNPCTPPSGPDRTLPTYEGAIRIGKEIFVLPAHLGSKRASFLGSGGRLHRCEAALD